MLEVGKPYVRLEYGQNVEPLFIFEFSYDKLHTLNFFPKHDFIKCNTIEIQKTDNMIKLK